MKVKKRGGRRTAVAEARPKPTGKEGPRDERRVQLIDAAYAVIAEKGLEGVRTRDIAARAGVNISTLHYYFGTKEALLLAVIERVRDMFSRRDDARPPSEDTLRSHLDLAWRSFQTTPHLTVVLQELVTRAQRDRSAQIAFRELHAFWNAMVEDVLRSGIDRKEIRADVDPVAAARIVTSFIMGATAQLGVAPESFEFEHVARELERMLVVVRRR